MDQWLRDQQARFRPNRSCVDQIATLCIIVEQSNSPLYINYVDYGSAFDSINRDTLWKLLRHYGIGTDCRVRHSGQITKHFEVKTGVIQGCLLSPFLFLLVIDWIMKICRKQRNKWNPVHTKYTT